MLKEFNRKLKLEKILQGSIYGLSACLLVAAILICVFQLTKLTDWYFYLIAIGSGLLVFVATLLIYCLVNRINDKYVAKRIDQNFNLREKASTMVEFKDKDSLLIQKQREDAKRSIKLNHPRKLIIKLTMASLPLPLLGAGAFTTSFFTQDIVNMLTVEAEDPNFDDATDEIIDTIKDYIGKSQASAAFKEKLYEILEELRADLKGDVDIVSRYNKVQVAKGKVDEALDEVNTKEEIGAELKKEENFAPVGEAVESANVDGLEESFADIEKSVGYISTLQGVLDKLKPLINELKEVLKNSGVPSSDANYKTFSDLLAKLEAIYNNVESKLSSTAGTTAINKLILDSREQIKKAIEEAIENLKSDLTLEKANDQLAEDVKKLMDQLIDPSSTNGDSDIEQGGSNNNQDGEEGDVGNEGDQETDANEGEEGGAEGGEGNGDGEKGDGSGTGSGGQEGEGQGQGQGEGAGSGSGDTQYGSNDKVYTGENGQTEYGEVIGDYQNDASDDAKNTGDDDLEGAIGDYFDELYGNVGDKTNP